MIGVSEEALAAVVRNLQILQQIVMDAEGARIDIRLRKAQLERQLLSRKMLYIVVILRKLAQLLTDFQRAPGPNFSRNIHCAD